MLFLGVGAGRELRFASYLLLSGSLGGLEPLLGKSEHGVEKVHVGAHRLPATRKRRLKDARTRRRAPPRNKLGKAKDLLK